MKYISTRSTNANKENGIDSALAIKQGLASDGGLFMPDEIPTLTKEDFLALCKMDYAKRAAKIMSLFLSDYTLEELEEDCAYAYSNDNFDGGANRLTDLDGVNHILELWHGPTCAFKDMALQIMPKLLSRALKKTNEKRKAFILVATSGDTGKAALEGYKDVEGTEISVFYPVDGVSDIQKLQMATQSGDNVFVTAVKGNFDDAQNGVKAIFSDREFADKINEKGYFLSSANSINWGRLAPQIVYYVSAYCDMMTEYNLKFGDEINVCVPTGNFGNIFAAYLAKQMGTPIKKLVCASNQNNVLTDFFNTGCYDRQREFHMTISPSMDILISSNLERLLYFVCGAEKVSGYMKELKETGRYTISDDEREIFKKDFYASFASEENTKDTIKKIFDEKKYLCDPHTAVAVYCAKKYQNETGDFTPMVVASTASPYKFSSSVLDAINKKKFDDEFDAINALYEESGLKIPKSLSELKTKDVRFNTVISPSDMQDTVFGQMKR